MGYAIVQLSAWGKCSSFEVIDSILSKLSNEQLFRQLSDVIITGHSSRCSICSHVFFFKTKQLFQRIKPHFAVVNNQYFTHPDSTRMQPNGSLTALDDCDGYNDWPYGLKT